MIGDLETGADPLKKSVPISNKTAVTLTWRLLGIYPEVTPLTV